MIQLVIDTSGLLKLEKALVDLRTGLSEKAIDIALTRTVAATRRDLIAEMPKIFADPTPFTVNSVRYAPSQNQEASVYISDDAAKGISPRKYLGPEIEGGARGIKRGERVLMAAGMMNKGQWLVPGRSAPIDTYGNIPGPKMVQILSRVGAFGQQGFAANASKATKARLRKAGLAVKSTGTNFFVAHTKSGGEPLGVWEIVSSGVVRPVLVFTNKRPNYQVRFHFHAFVEKYAAAHWTKEMEDAFQHLVSKIVGGS